MYSLSTRANSVFFYFVVCLTILCGFNILTTVFIKNYPAISKFDISKFTSLYNHPYTKVQHAVGLINMDIDFTPCFNWNTNLVFAWISATYKTGKNGLETKVTVYDNIMLRSEAGSHKIRFDKKSFEYPLVDLFRTLESREVEFELNWEHMPVVGPILKVTYLIFYFF
jgi:signal peptidase complex subunit 3